MASIDGLTNNPLFINQNPNLLISKYWKALLIEAIHLDQNPEQQGPNVIGIPIEPIPTTRVQANFPKNTSNITSPTEWEIAEVGIAGFLSAKLSTPVDQESPSSTHYFDKKYYINFTNNSTV